MHFISAKIHRAVLSEIEEKEMKHEDSTFDSKNSAFLAYVAIVKIINALKALSHLKNLHQRLHQKTKKFIPLFEELNGVLEERFELEFPFKLSKKIK
jgi:acetylornithine/succinyldiaminopimelate/putrescine aminotransferase